MNDGNGDDQPYISSDCSGSFSWNFSQNDSNGSGAVTNRASVVKNANAAEW